MMSASSHIINSKAQHHLHPLGYSFSAVNFLTTYSRSLDVSTSSFSASMPLKRVTNQCITYKDSFTDLHSKQTRDLDNKKEDGKREGKPQLQLPIREKLFDKASSSD